VAKKNDEIKQVDAAMPQTPDPFWPAGVAPRHLSVGKQSESAIVAPYLTVTGPIWHCEKCHGTVDKNAADPRYCNSCYELETQNSSVAKKMNSSWMDEAGLLGLELFERQPEETNLEWRIWETYRSYYPRKMPTWNELADACESSVVTVVKTAAKWSFKVRLMSWSRFTDEGIQEKRIAAIKEMNVNQLSMAQTIQEKLKTAIEILDPTLLRPGEIVNLFKVATELERKITTYVDEKVESESLAGKNKGLTLTKAEDLNEVVAILQKTGLLDNKTIGIEQTTRIIAKED